MYVSVFLFEILNCNAFSQNKIHVQSQIHKCQHAHTNILDKKRLHEYSPPNSPFVSTINTHTHTHTYPSLPPLHTFQHIVLSKLTFRMHSK